MIGHFSLDCFQVPHWNTLLLEAGPDENEISDVPSLAAYLQLTDLDWQYKTEPTGKSCLGMKVRSDSSLFFCTFATSRCETSRP